jgi:hypothetical protein
MIITQYQYEEPSPLHCRQIMTFQEAYEVEARKVKEGTNHQQFSKPGQNTNHE